MTEEEVARSQEIPGNAHLVTVTGSVVLTETDFTSVWLALPHVRRLMISLVYLVFGLSFVGWSGIFEQKHRYAIAVIIALVGGVFLVLRANRVRSQFARDSLEQAGGKGHVRFCFEVSGYSVQIGAREVQFDWTNALMAVETREAFVIYDEPRAFLVIPKRSFETYKLADLRHLISECVPMRRSGQVSDWRQSLVKPVLLLVALWALVKIVGF
jgi:hypothetical protein